MTYGVNNWLFGLRLAFRNPSFFSLMRRGEGQSVRQRSSFGRILDTKNVNRLRISQFCIGGGRFTLAFFLSFKNIFGAESLRIHISIHTRTFSICMRAFRLGLSPSGGGAAPCLDLLHPLSGTGASLPVSACAGARVAAVCTPAPAASFGIVA